MIIFKAGLTVDNVNNTIVYFKKFFWRTPISKLSPNPLLMYSANVKDSENADRWLAALTSSIIH